MSGSFDHQKRGGGWNSYVSQPQQARTKIIFDTEDDMPEEHETDNQEVDKAA